MADANINNKWKVKEVELNEIVPTEVNANKMTDKEFNKLVDNIRKTGLSSMIACYKRNEDGKYVIISGNHRYRACVKLGYSKINILFADENDLEKDEIIALQLSHNSLHGSDDKSILRRLFDEIQSIDFKEFAHIDIEDLKLEDIYDANIVPVSEHFSVNLILYNDDLKNLEELLEIVNENQKKSDIIILADGKNTKDEFITAISDVKKQFEIKSASIAFSKILELARANMIQMTQNEEKN